MAKKEKPSQRFKDRVESSSKKSARKPHHPVDPQILCTLCVYCTILLSNKNTMVWNVRHPARPSIFSRRNGRLARELKHSLKRYTAQRALVNSHCREQKPFLL